MTISDYYKILELSHESSVEEIKKAYRKKAREFHPDINHSPNAKDQFICITEAYEFLVTNHEKMMTDSQAFKQAMEDWRRYRQVRSRRRAGVYAQASYSRFKNSNFYKTTRIFDGTTIISCLIVSIMVLFIAVFGYFYQLHHPDPVEENPSVAALIFFLLLGMVLFVISFIYLKAYIQTSKKYKKT